MKILDALLVLKEQAIKGFIDEPRYGICCNLSVLTWDTDASYEFVKDNCSDWQNFSGNTSYPVILDTDCRLWEGEQLELRLSLINHLITKAKDLEI